MQQPSVMPLVSIIVPSFNHAPFLEERLHSILRQSFQDFELLILDDASTDDSLRVIGETLSDHPHELVRNERNSGRPCLQWLRGLSLAKGTYIWIAESDDSCSPRFLETMVHGLEEGAVLAFCRTIAVDADRWRSSFRIDGRELCRRFMARGNVIANASSVVFRKPDLRTHAGLKRLTRDRRYTGDWVFWTHFLMRMGGTVRFEAEELSSFRFHEQTTRSTASRSLEKLRFREYSGAVHTILRSTHPLPRLRWVEIAKEGSWDWILYEYLFRYNPRLLEKIFVRIIHGPLRLGLYLRLLQSATLRRRYLRWANPIPQGRDGGETQQTESPPLASSRSADERS
jgi:glycosyltransferase involved in cell wall biosynthesis